uniref:Reverse transcriptase n=1 Tax=Boechera divaricarpa TaxID=115915 RepID=B6REL2_9BRAS|nr:reverse transcriptase [Boechera divaricarpa]
MKTTFLHGELKEFVHVFQLDGFVKRGEEDKVYKLSKALYGWRQAPRAWNNKLDQILKGLNFRRCPKEQSVYTKQEKGFHLIVAVYVDDLFITGSSLMIISEFMKDMSSKFEMTDLGKLTYYLGIKVTQGVDGICIKQEGYALKILMDTSMETCSRVHVPMDSGLKLLKAEEKTEVDATRYRRTIGCLRHLLHTKLDLAYAVGALSRYMHNPKESHRHAIKHVLRYVKGTTSLGLRFKRDGDERIVGYSDSSHNIDTDDGKSTGGHVFYLELLGDVIEDKSKKVVIRIDNKSTIALTKNLVFHGRSKHILSRYHFIRECVENEQVEVEHVPGIEHRADILTKTLACVKFKEMRDKIGVEDFHNLSLKIMGENIG